MKQAALTRAVLERQLQKNLERRPEAPVFAFQARGGWEGPECFQVKGHTCRVAWCPSSLAMRESLAAHHDGDTLVLLTPLAASDLGSDLLARLPRARLLPVDLWEVLCDLFDAVSFDPRLGREEWLAEALLEVAPGGGFRPVAAGHLDRATAWETFLEHRFGFPGGRSDLLALLRWTTGEARVAELAAAPAEVRRQVAGRLQETAGRPGAAVAGLLAAHRGTDAVPVGLACRVVFAAEAEAAPEREAAAVRLEPWLGGEPLPPQDGLAWADAAEEVMASMADEPVATRRLLQRADGVLEELKAARWAHLSPLLPAGYRQRLERFAEVLRGALTGTVPGAELEAAGSSVLAHRQPLGSRAGGVEMALRLERWLRCRQTPPPASLREAARAYGETGAFVDWARVALGRAEGGAALAPIYRDLLAQVEIVREEENRLFARLLSSWLAAGGRHADLPGVEELMEGVVAPLAAEGPVLVVVADGLSLAVLEELTADLLRYGWTELVPVAGGRRITALATAPSVTDRSRCSLLAGRLARGGQSEEKRGFEGNPALRAVSGSNLPPALFHKAGVRGAGGLALEEGLRREVERKARRVVGVVINAVDDQIERDEQIAAEWSVETIRPLAGLLDAAAAAGRRLVLISDHGHVMERGTRLHPGSGDGARFRAVGGELAEGEVELAGERVLAEGGRIVAAWSERLRYGRKSAGYHGGASPQEMLVPAAVFRPDEKEVAGWRALPAALPGWWEGEESPVAARPEPATPRRKRRRREEPEPQIELFHAAREGRATPPAAADWIEQLLASDTFARQQSQAGPARLPEERLRQILGLLERHGGRMTRNALARALNLPPLRLNGYLAGLERLLNVEGYPVVRLADGGNTLQLDRGLLATQFELDLPTDG